MNIFGFRSTRFLINRILAVTAETVPQYALGQQKKNYFSAWHWMIFFLLLQPQKEKIMARVCQITGKKTVSGNNVSHANNKTKRKFYPNLQNKRLFLEEEGIWVNLRVSTHALRIINKLGLGQALRKSGLEIVRL